MTVADLFELCVKAGLWEKDQTSFRNKVNHLARASVIPNQEGGGGQAKMGHYPPETGLRLRCALTLEKPAPHGLGYTRVEEVRAFLGAVGDERTVDEFLPAVAYALRVPGVDVEEARRAGVRFVRKQTQEGREDRKKAEQSGTTLPSSVEALVYIGMGRPAYREAATFGIPDNFNDPNSTLRDELNSAILPKWEWVKPYALTDEEFSKAARISHPALRYLAMKRAPEPVLREAAFWARLWMLATGSGPAPRGETLLTQWGFWTALLLYVPLASQVCGLMKQGLEHFGPPERTLRLLDNAEFRKFMEKGNFDAAAIVATNELCPID